LKTAIDKQYLRSNILIVRLQTICGT